jgi:thiosulfate/3-mercaptopyruvate sulfurtransferase
MRRAVIPILAFSILCGAVVSCSRPAPPIASSDLIQIDELATLLADSTSARPALLQVGFAPLYRSGHIPGSHYAGPGSKPEGLAALRKALQALPADQPVVLYCGCCPWTDCPNVRPAFQLAKQSGRSNVRVLYVNGNLERDWIDKGLPSAKGEE